MLTLRRARQQTAEEKRDQESLADIRETYGDIPSGIRGSILRFTGHNLCEYALKNAGLYKKATKDEYKTAQGKIDTGLPVMKTVARRYSNEVPQVDWSIGGFDLDKNGSVDEVWVLGETKDPDLGIYSLRVMLPEDALFKKYLHTLEEHPDFKESLAKRN